MCWALLAFMVSFNLFIPEMNGILKSMNAVEDKGLLFFLFAMTSALARPFSGKLSDTIGRKKVMYLGIYLGFISCLLYPIATLGIFLSIRLLHGLSAGFFPTGSTALVTDTLPSEGRGVAMGIWGTFISVGFGFGNFFAYYLKPIFGLDGLFYLAGGFALLSGFFILQVSETLANPKPFEWKFLRISWKDVLEPSVRPAAFVMFCSATSTGVMFVTSPDISEFLGIPNKGWFFMFYMTSTILIRLFASSMSDKIGRRKALIIGLAFMAISMVSLGTSTEWIQYTIGAILFGVSTGISSPTVMAWMADLAPAHRRGVGSGTLFIALEFAIMMGGAITMLVYDSTLESVPLPYFISASLSIVGVVYLMWHLRYRTSAT